MTTRAVRPRGPARQRKPARAKPGRPAVEQPGIGGRIEGILDGLGASNDAVRHKVFRVALRIAGETPEKLLPAWPLVVRLLASENAFHRSIAAQLVPKIAAADGGARFRRIAARYWSLLDDPSVMTARFAARSAAVVAANIPSLRGTAVTRLLAIESSHHRGTRKELVKADAIQALGEIYPLSTMKPQIRRFVEAQQSSPSGTARRAAREFLARHTG